MEVVSKPLDNGQFSVTFTGTSEELQAEFLEGAEQLDAEGEERGSDLMRKAYCCTCSDGHKHTVQASHSRSAFFKCLGKCSGGFSMRHGDCNM